MENCSCAAKLENRSYFSSNLKSIWTIDLIGQVLKRLLLRQTDQWGAPIYKMKSADEVKTVFSNYFSQVFFHKNGKHFFVFQATVNLGQTRRKRFQVKNIFHSVEIHEKAKNAWFTIFPSHHFPIWSFDSFVWIPRYLQPLLVV